MLIGAYTPQCLKCRGNWINFLFFLWHVLKPVLDVGFDGVCISLGEPVVKGHAIILVWIPHNLSGIVYIKFVHLNAGVLCIELRFRKILKLLFRKIYVKAHITSSRNKLKAVQRRVLTVPVRLDMIVCARLLKKLVEDELHSLGRLKYFLRKLYFKRYASLCKVKIFSHVVEPCFIKEFKRNDRKPNWRSCRHNREHHV